MKNIILFLALSFLFAACEKEKDVDKSPKVLTYTIYDSTFTIDDYVNGRDGYRRYHSDSSFPTSYTESLTIDTFSEVKQLVFRGVYLEREVNKNSSFKKISPSPLVGDVIWITLKGDSLFISCAYEKWQTESKSYVVKGIKK